MKIFVAGDYCPQERVADMLSMQDFSFFDNIKEVVKGVDYSIANLECPIVVGDVKPIIKCGRALRTNADAVKSLKYAGFDCVTLANNHFRDFGDEGCITTINELQKHNIDFVGGGRNLDEAQKILYKEINGKTLAIVNLCETEFSIATDTKAGSAPLDAVDNYNQITQARSNADYVLVIVHGGHEHYQLPSPRMQKLYRHFITIGADAVVNHHQHCYSGYEYFNNKPIIYGLGNLCFDKKTKRNTIWNEGYCAILQFNTNKVEITLIPYKQCNETPTVETIQGADKHHFEVHIEQLNKIISDKDQLKVEFELWCANRAPAIKTIFNSYHNRYLNGAASRGWISRPASREEQTLLFNYLVCESHRDITIDVLFKNLIKDE